MGSGFQLSTQYLECVYTLESWVFSGSCRFSRCEDGTGALISVPAVNSYIVNVYGCTER